MINSVLETEKAAQQMLDDALREADIIRAQAQADKENLCAENEKSVKSQSDAIISQAHAKAEQVRNDALVRAGEEAEKLISEAQIKTDSAVRQTVEYIKELNK